MVLEAVLPTTVTSLCFTSVVAAAGYLLLRQWWSGPSADPDTHLPLPTRLYGLPGLGHTLDFLLHGPEAFRRALAPRGLAVAQVRARDAQAAPARSQAYTPARLVTHT